MALAYVARFATTRAKLETYLKRKLRERGWDGDGDPPVVKLAERFVSAGYVDDKAYAKAKTGSLLRRGYGARRVGQALNAAGVDQDIREEVGPSVSEQRQAALTMARKRGFGPYGRQDIDPARREKQIAAMIRGGHSFDAAIALIDAADTEQAETWAAELSDEESDDEMGGGIEW